MLQTKTSSSSAVTYKVRGRQKGQGDGGLKEEAVAG